MARTTWLLLLLALPACEDAGTFDYVPPGGTPDDGVTDPVGGDDSGINTPDTPARPDRPEAPVRTSFEHCGGELIPGTFPGRTFLGDATVRQEGFTGAVSWAGCEVERRYRADGSFLCEVSWTVSGDGQLQRDTPNFLYELRYEADLEHSNCDQDPASFDTVAGYDIEFGRREQNATLYRASGDEFFELGTFPLGGGFTEQTIRYQWEAP